MEKLPEHTIAYKKLLLAIEDIGGCLVDLSRVAIQGIREDNEAARGGIAAGLERAAAAVRGQPYIVAGKP